MFSFHVIPKTGQGERPDQISYNLLSFEKVVELRVMVVRASVKQSWNFAQQ